MTTYILVEKLIKNNIFTFCIITAMKTNLLHMSWFPAIQQDPDIEPATKKKHRTYILVSIIVLKLCFKNLYPKLNFL